jgi:5'-nucleotidase
MHRPIRVKPVKLADGSPAMASDGAPADCVALAFLGIVEQKIDLVVSGINPHANLGYDITYSGTVSAAFEAAIGGVPGIAVSLETPRENYTKNNFQEAAKVARKIANQVLARGLPEDTILNVNVPYLQEDELKEWHITRQGRRIYRDELLTNLDPKGNAYYWIGGDPPTGIAEDHTDVGCILSNCVSITPLKLDLSDYAFMEELRKWTWDE